MLHLLTHYFSHSCTVARWVITLSFFGVFFTFAILCNASPQQMPSGIVTQAGAFVVATCVLAPVLTICAESPTSLLIIMRAIINCVLRVSPHPNIFTSSLPRTMAAT
jgi:hypothetical protein